MADPSMQLCPPQQLPGVERTRTGMNSRASSYLADVNTLSSASSHSGRFILTLWKNPPLFEPLPAQRPTQPRSQARPASSSRSEDGLAIMQ